MSIKSDKWIKQMAIDHQMIMPFAHTQIRTTKRQTQLAHGHGHPSSVVEKIISYGLSSYGYDVRAAPEWKVFTNVNSTVIDPKNFDDKSFVSIEADHIIIPPNSFAL
jgi:dCTP deaminase